MIFDVTLFVILVLLNMKNILMEEEGLKNEQRLRERAEEAKDLKRDAELFDLDPLKEATESTKLTSLEIRQTPGLESSDIWARLTTWRMPLVQLSGLFPALSLRNSFHLTSSMPFSQQHQLPKDIQRLTWTCVG